MKEIIYDYFKRKFAFSLIKIMSRSSLVNSNKKFSVVNYRELNKKKPHDTFLDNTLVSK